MEAALQVFLPQFIDRSGICHHASKVVNIPWNRVQTDWDNRCASPNAATSVEEMLEYWEQGFQIDLSGIYGVLNESVHQEFPLVLEDR